jgi:hypothetical protein
VGAVAAPRLPAPRTRRRCRLSAQLRRPERTRRSALRASAEPRRMSRSEPPVRIWATPLERPRLFFMDGPALLSPDLTQPARGRARPRPRCDESALVRLALNDAKLGSRGREPPRREMLNDHVQTFGRRLQAVRRRQKVIRSLSLVIGLGPVNDLERRLWRKDDCRRMPGHAEREAMAHKHERGARSRDLGARLLGRKQRHVVKSGLLPFSERTPHVDHAGPHSSS